ncbi:MAG: hypothetical protein WCH62_07145, partial [Candidatus Omnitrophota bacterium]
IGLVGIVLLSFNAQVYITLGQQKKSMELSINKAIEQQQKIAVLEKDLQNLIQQIDELKNIKNSMEGVNITIDTMKKDMISWQKDYVEALKENEGKLEDIQEQVKILKEKLDSQQIPEIKDRLISLQATVERISHSQENQPTDQTLIAPQKETRLKYDF